jgi:hypothetical protein
MTTITDTPETLVALWMRSQHGLVTRSQALGAGVSANQLDWRRRRGLWVPVQQGVYCLPGSRRSREQAILAACLALGGETVASHRSAAWLWGMIHPSRARVEVTVPYGRRPSLPRIVVHRTRLKLVSAKLHEIPITSPVGTIIDLAQNCDTDLLETALDRCDRMRLVTGADLLAELDRRDNHGAAGIRILRRLLAERGYPGVPASALERRTLDILRKGGVPDPVRELTAGPYRVDFAWPAARIMVEVDGFATHSTPEALSADLARQNKLIAMGWIPLRYTWRDVTRRPYEVVAQVKQMLSRGELKSEPGSATRKLVGLPSVEPNRSYTQV